MSSAEIHADTLQCAISYNQKITAALIVSAWMDATRGE